MFTNDAKIFSTLRAENIPLTRAGFKTPHLGQSPRWAQISILKILNVFLRLKFSPVLILTKLKRFEIGSPSFKYRRVGFSL